MRIAGRGWRRSVWWPAASWWRCGDDGGAAANNLLLQFQSGLLGVPVVRPRVAETTALGAAYLAGLGVGFWKNRRSIATRWQIDRRFKPAMTPAERRRLLGGWARALSRSRGWDSPSSR